jgi:hypothetical protein
MSKPTHFIASRETDPSCGDHDMYIPELTTHKFNPRQPTIPIGGAHVSIVEETPDHVVLRQHVIDYHHGTFQPSCMIIVTRKTFDMNSTTLPIGG